MPTESYHNRMIADMEFFELTEALFELKEFKFLLQEAYQFARTMSELQPPNKYSLLQWIDETERQIKAIMKEMGCRLFQAIE